MDQIDSDILSKLLPTFKVEVEEHLTAISSGLIELERAPSLQAQITVLETIFREVHSLKGAARAVNVVEIEEISHSMEGVLAALKRQEVALSPELFDLLHRTVDYIGKLLLSVEMERTDSEKSQIRELIQHLETVSKETLSPPNQEGLGPKSPDPGSLSKGARPARAAENPTLAETVRISTRRLNAVLLEAEELLSAKLMAGQRAAELREIQAALTVWNKEWAKVQPEVRKVQRSLERKDPRNQVHNQEGLLKTAPTSRLNGTALTPKLLEFLDWNYTHLKALENKLTALARSTEYDHRSLAGMVDNLLEDMKKVLMLPFSSLLKIFPKIVRELSRDQGKQVELVIQGEDIEMDRRILEEIKDPLIHLVRNCIDHGIEKPEERRQNKKSPQGKITLAISQKDGRKVEILVSDDGAGIDTAKVRAKAVQLGIVSPEEAEKLTEQEAVSLIFQSGISTSPTLTDISGRGLGLAIVREKVEKLGGLISVETYPAIGSSFRILLPLTLATFRGVLVQVAAQLFVIPTANVERVVRIKRSEIKTVENKETLLLNGDAVSLVRLDEVLELPQKEKKPEYPGQEGMEFISVLILSAGERRIAFSVDKVLNEQEVLVKSLGKQLSRVRNIAGATVLGTGQVVPILNVQDLMKSAVKATRVPLRTAMAAEEAEMRKKSILIVEDSITTRALLKNILETAGYQVKTAVDGIDAFTTLLTEDFDLVVSDIEMPRMNGFDLVTKIRHDRKLAEIPVVLVTALESREDQERGIDVGANAYIVKSSLKQGNLLEVIQKLV